MKDIIIPGRRLKNELLVLIGCFAAAFCTNIFAVIKYSRPFTELFTMIGFVVALTLVIYFLLWVVRIVVALVRLPFRKKQEGGSL